ncbi:hypothetical protein Lesp02_43720 [Lentzea sp. NBRC 105346]|uniref:DUF3995 domain-containing protein n=1 Tax=Lentzea sp. NBRC 105346 TaxID=3032205 RepID=UPI0024A382F0|nr:DUF3995 domain-containing protein [Lentzea sp. NBRC 105346]GLZ32184.1 hypothetical protein Lesp02_43720 [Lentzea sp. NBRC 105346]
MLDSSATSTDRTTNPWFGYATAVWAFAFAVLHVYWAFGGGWGLPSGFSVPDHTALFVIDVIAVPLCLGGGVLGLALVRPWGLRFPRWMRLAAAWAMAALCLVHSVPTVVQAGLVLARGEQETLSVQEKFSFFGYEPYWFVGGVVVAIAALLHQRAHPRREAS